MNLVVKKYSYEKLTKGFLKDREFCTILKVFLNYLYVISLYKPMLEQHEKNNWCNTSSYLEEKTKETVEYYDHHGSEIP